MDQQSYAGFPIEIPRDERVALFDEFDFIRDDEGRKTQYNYARPTGKTPKQMTWFYQVVNDFYTINSKEHGLLKARELRPITIEVLKAFAQTLLHAVGDNEEKQSVIADMLRDPIQLVQWLQSAHEAHVLEWGVGFTVRDEAIHVGEESYPMREIIPLSSDNQKMVGSTFSAGVQQLLAVRLNKDAMLEGKPQNFHIHPESNIISSQVAAQRMDELWGLWEGFSGTISAAQATALHTEHQTEVLHVPTNQRDLRSWNKPLFYKTADGHIDVNQRLDAIVAQIRICLEKKQSILFSCRNDKQVAELEGQLRKKLTDDELANFIFYTNEDKRSPNAVLADKRTQETWLGGKKQKGIVLVASGFGRGDNVDVEAVFLLNVNDTNDLLQKGGRTARNGEEGNVFQFYLAGELEDEENYLMAFLRASGADGDIDSVAEELQKIEGDDEDANRFERVMLLREYVFNLQNAANQGYHNAIAQLSSWGMQLLGGIADPTLRHELTVFVSKMHKRLEKEWVRLSSDPDTTVNEKITSIEQAITDEAAGFFVRYNDELGGLATTIPAFALIERQPVAIKLVVTEVPKATQQDRAIAAICSVLTRLPDLQLDSRAAQIPAFLTVLAEGSPARLQKLAVTVGSCTSIGPFVDLLEIAVRQTEDPVEELDESRERAEKEISIRRYRS